MRFGLEKFNTADFQTCSRQPNLNKLVVRRHLYSEFRNVIIYVDSLSSKEEKLKIFCPFFPDLTLLSSFFYNY